MPATGLSDSRSNVLAETVLPDGSYRFRLFEGDVVGVQKPDSSAEEGWSTSYVFRDGVCPCTGHQYRGDCKHKPIAQSLIAWWRDVGSKAAPVPAVE